MTYTQTLERDIGLRFSCAALSFSTFLLGWFSPTSIPAGLRLSPGGFGIYLVMAFGVSAFVIAADTYINDVREEGNIKWTSRYRYMIHCIPALLYLDVIYCAVLQPDIPPPKLAVLFLYVVMCSMNVWAAWRDTKRRPSHAYLCGA